MKLVIWKSRTCYSSKRLLIMGSYGAYQKKLPSSSADGSKDLPAECVDPLKVVKKYGYQL
jgi:hypothetical protein